MTTSSQPPSSYPPSSKHKRVLKAGTAVLVGGGAAVATNFILNRISPQELWQYGAPILLTYLVIRLGNAAIRVMEKIADRIEKHEHQDEERHKQLLEKLGGIREQQISFHG